MPLSPLVLLGGAPVPPSPSGWRWFHLLGGVRTSIFGGLDLIQPMVDRRQGQWLDSAQKWRSPQSTSACERPLVHVRTVLPPQSEVATDSSPTAAA